MLMMKMNEKMNVVASIGVLIIAASVAKLAYVAPAIPMSV